MQKKTKIQEWHFLTVWASGTPGTGYKMYCDAKLRGKEREIDYFDFRKSKETENFEFHPV